MIASLVAFGGGLWGQGERNRDRMFIINVMHSIYLFIYLFAKNKESGYKSAVLLVAFSNKLNLNIISQ